MDVVWLILYVSVYYWGSSSISYDPTLAVTLGLIDIKPKHSYYKNKLVSRGIFKNYLSSTAVLREGKSSTILPTIGVIHSSSTSGNEDKLNPY